MNQKFRTFFHPQAQLMLHDKVSCDCNQSFLIDSAVKIFVTRLRGARFSLIVCFFYLTSETAAWKFSVKFSKNKTDLTLRKGTLKSRRKSTGR